MSPSIPKEALAEISFYFLPIETDMKRLVFSYDDNMKKTSFFMKKEVLLTGIAAVLMFGSSEKAQAKLWVGEQTQEETAETAAQVQEAAMEMNVLLMTTGYQSYYHPSVDLEVNGQPVSIAMDSEAFSKGDIVITPRSQEDAITVLSIERQQGCPAYKGSLILKKREAGIVIVNRLSLEDYLCGVVPSEMPAYYEEEALKAQAVCARTYACRQKQQKTLGEYGADVDDSVNYQVYNNIQPQEATTQAVWETEGQILCQNGSPIEAYYFSTSSGTTSTDEVWESQEEASYLKSVACLYDASEPWSKWQVSFPMERIENLASQYFGISEKVERLAVGKISQSGAVTQLRVITDQGEETIHKEYAIRSFLSPYGLPITQKDGTINEYLTTLPSAYFSLEPYYDENGVLAGYTLYGGGYGHGVGMSQNGANHMAEEGTGYQEILDYFFNQVELTQVSELEQQ